ncbi:MAG: endonuclease domain-containing protein [Candidatus Doudnabacteria bacterium]|nr:endonuclease domain-containing protein [Candidatus Doudnabacteria bacterium]
MRINNILLENSKLQRKSQNPWEAKLWYYLRAKRFQDFKFRRQVAIGPFIVDFYCHKLRLIIELDGSQHNENTSILKDRARQKYLTAQGYRVLRFWNNELDDNIDGVLKVIYNALTTS